MACLASRIPYGSVITREKLKKIEIAEEFLLSNNFKQFRVRYHNAVAYSKKQPIYAKRSKFFII